MTSTVDPRDWYVVEYDGDCHLRYMRNGPNDSPAVDVLIGGFSIEGGAIVLNEKNGPRTFRLLKEHRHPEHLEDYDAVVNRVIDIVSRMQ